MIVTGENRIIPPALPKRMHQLLGIAVTERELTSSHLVDMEAIFESYITRPHRKMLEDVGVIVPEDADHRAGEVGKHRSRKGRAPVSKMKDQLYLFRMKQRDGFGDVCQLIVGVRDDANFHSGDPV